MEAALSVPALHSLSQTVTNRFLSLKLALEELVARLASRDAQLAQFALLVEQLAGTVEQFHQRLGSASFLSPVLRQSLAESLSAGEETASGLSGAVKRAREEDGLAELEGILGTAELLKVHSQVFAVFYETLNMHDDHDQGVVLGENQEIFEDRDRLMEQYRLFGTTPAVPSSPRAAPLPEKGGDLPDYETATSNPIPHRVPPPVHDGIDDDDSGGVFSGFFKTLTSLPSLLRRVEPLVSPLCQAASIGNNAVIEGLLAEGANIEGINEEGRTALISAILAGQLSTVSLLLDRGASVLTKDSNKVIPPLFHAAEAGQLSIMSLLVDRGADPNMRGSFGQPFFVGAVESAPLEAVRLLLDRGSDPNTVSISGKPVIIDAAKKGNLEVMKLLVNKGAKTSARHPSGQSLIQLAVVSRNADMVRFLLERGADASARGPSGQCILSMAIGQGDMAVARLLISHGADIEARETHGGSILATALSKNSAEAVRLLIEHGADVNVKDFNGKTILRSEIDGGKAEYIRVLLQHGANPNITDFGGKTVLLAALKNTSPNSEAILAMLLQHGADPNISSSNWATAQNSPLGQCVQHSRLGAARLLLQHRADPNRRYMSGETPFHFAVAKQKLDFVSLMLEYGGNPNVRDGSGSSSLSLAAAKGDLRVVEVLARGGAVVYLGEGKSAKGPLAAARKAEKWDVVRFLEAWTKDSAREAGSRVG